MKFIIVNQKNGRSLSFSANALTLALLMVVLLAGFATLGFSAYRYGLESAGATTDLVDDWRSILREQNDAVDLTRRESLAALDATTMRLAQLQARVVRLDALGERLTVVGNLDKGEFDFSQDPPLGGPESETFEQAYAPPSFIEMLDQLSMDIADREQQLAVLETLLSDRQMQRDVFIAGRPVRSGWVSSRYGRRTDPITGRLAWHSGVDFAGRRNGEVVAVAAGVVVSAGPSGGYGQMVEINHGSGFSTRYGHHSKLLVKVGDVVQKGQVLGLMGRSGRSTGPHVHFEVYKNGRSVDPSSYILRASR